MRKTHPLPRRSPETRKELILDAATEILAEKQYQDVPVSEIVKKAGVAQGTFYLYFPTKHDVLQAIGDRMFGLLQKQVALVADEQPTTVDFVRVMHGFALKTVKRFSGLLSLIDSDKLFFSKAQKRHNEPPALLFHTLERLIRRDQENGVVPADIDPVIASRFIVSLIDRYMRDMRKDGPAFRGEVYGEQMMTFLRRGLGMKDV